MINWSELVENICTIADRHLPNAYYIGMQQALKEMRITHKWDEKDQVNVNELLEQFRIEVLNKVGAISMLPKEQIIPALKQFSRHATSWAWTSSPAMALGKLRVVELVNALKQEQRLQLANSIEQSTGNQLINGDFNLTNDAKPTHDPDNEPIGLIWYTEHDDKVCSKCDFLNGRWFAGNMAYQLASSIHPNCRCSANFHLGYPSDAPVGPIGDYNANSTIDDIFSQIGGGLRANARRLNNASNVLAQERNINTRS